MDFVKMEGLGNDFMVVTGPLHPSPSDVAAWCDRRRGVGADGLLVVTPHDPGVRMQYWNADGSVAEMCGNGLRCVARYAVGEGLVSNPSFPVLTAVGERAVELRDGGIVRASLGPISEAAAGPLDLAGYHLDTVSVGNPHAVAIVNDCYAVPVDAVGPIVEGDPHFPDRTNVEFATVTGFDRIVLEDVLGLHEQFVHVVPGLAVLVLAHAIRNLVLCVVLVDKHIRTDGSSRP